MLTEKPLQRIVAVGVLLLWIATAFGHDGQVRFGEAPVPGVAVQATRGDVIERAVTDAEGRYSLPKVNEAGWKIRISAPGFEPLERELDPTANSTTPVQWELKMLPIESLQRSTPTTGFPKFDPPVLQPGETTAETQDRLLINGTVSNAASSPFALSRAIGNNRAGGRSPYNASVSVSGSNAVLDARSFSLTGQDTPKPDYNRLQTGINVAGPFQIPGWFRNGSFNASYSRTQNRDASVETGLMPTSDQRLGVVNPQAQALLALYPLPNFTDSTRYNYQIPVVGVTHGDNIQGNLNNFVIDAGNRLSGSAGYQSTRSDDPDLFGFTDVARSATKNASITWNRRMTRTISAVIRYQFTQSSTKNLPYFANQIDVSGIAGISGNDRDPRNWGPPALNFSGGITRLSTGTYSSDRSISHTVSYNSTWIRGRHGFNYGGDYRRQQYNLFSQRDPRGSFTFTGAATGNDFEDFRQGIPTASSIAFGNPDKYFRQWFANGFITDDWKVKSALTLTLGVRWEYESPVIEKYGRLVNLDIDQNFTSAAPKTATPTDSLVRTDKTGLEPRLGLAWKPRATSSLIVRVGYGLYRDTSVYRSIADQMAQQAPLSRSLSVQNTPDNPLTLADGFKGSPTVSAATFAVDPDFRVGTAQNWNLAIQQDLPAALQISLTYLGVKGTHVPQRILPNTFPSGSGILCAGCPTGFVYLMSGGSSNRHAGTVELRRRQRNGFQASVQYTYAKAIDDAGLGGSAIAQNWLDRRAERALSNFDQRHVVAVQGQYTAGTFSRVSGFWSGWRGKVFREWTLMSSLSVGSGRPLTPVILAPVAGTGITGSLRPNATGASPYIEQAGGFLNAAAFIAPAAGQWGNAGRNSIIGPSQFSLNASLTRTIRMGERLNMDIRVDANNVLNHVTFPDWNTTVGSLQYGLPTRPNAMRTLQPSLRMRW